MAPNDRTVSRRTVVWWAVTVGDALRASSVHRTQGEAIEAARRELLGAGGGELTIKDANGKVRGTEVVGGEGSGVAESEVRKSA